MKFFLTLALTILTGLSPFVVARTLKLGSSENCEVNYDSSFTSEQFPIGFSFGAGTAAFQSEGAAFVDGRGPSIWDAFTEVPGRIVDHANATVADDSYHNIEVDVGLLKKAGMKSYRFSISWSRVLPDGTGVVNEKGIMHYNKLIDSLIEAGIDPTVTLYHWDLPLTLEVSYGGWLNSSIAESFVEYAKLLFDSFGDRVKTWVTMNEPHMFAVRGYGEGTFAPGRCSDRTRCKLGNSSIEPYIVGHNLLRAHAAAAKLYKEKYQSKFGGSIGITLNSQFYFPYSNSSRDAEAANVRMQFVFGWFGDPLIFGDYPEIMKTRIGSRLPQFTPEEKILLTSSVDFFGINCYTGSYATFGSPPKPGEEDPASDDWVTISSRNINGDFVGSTTASGWLFVVPKAIYGLVMWVNSRYFGVPIIITENGTSDVGNGTLAESLCDQHRISFFQSYLKELLRAIKEGANVQGYFAWSLLDNFEWAKGYTERFGIYYVDFEDPKRTRYPKASSIWWSNFLGNPLRQE